MIKILFLFLFLLCSCQKSSVAPLPVTPIPIIPTPSVLTEEECNKINNVWLVEDKLCEPLTEFNLPSIDIADLPQDKVEILQRSYIQALYSIERAFSNVYHPTRMVVVKDLVVPVVIRNDHLLINPDKVSKEEFEIAILEIGVFDKQLSAQFYGFAMAKMKHFLTVKNLILEQTKVAPLMNRLIFKVSGERLQKKMQIIKGQEKVTVVIDSTAVTKEDVTEMLKQLKQYASGSKI